jgi:hypothetical protein
MEAQKLGRRMVGSERARCCWGARSVYVRVRVLGREGGRSAVRQEAGARRSAIR